MLVADEELWRYVGLRELHNEGKRAPHVSQGKIERALGPQGDTLIVFFFSPPALCFTAAARKRVKDTQKQPST